MVVDGRQWIVPLPSPPNGNMRPDGVRGLPGCTIDRGDCIAIHAGAPDFAIVAIVCVDDMAPIHGNYANHPDLPPYISVIDVNGSTLTLHQFFVDTGHPANSDWYGRDVTDQLPYGDFTPGRWAWLITGVGTLDEPIPCKGKQGVWRLPDDIAAQVTGGLA